MGLIKIKIKKKNKKKGKYKYSKFEIIFNLLSVAIVIGTGIYFGARAIYYYSKQNVKMQDEAQTINGWILNNNKIVEGDGLHQDGNGYYFKGKEANNYVVFANRLFRAIRVNNDNSVRLISEDVVSSFMWGEEESYDKSNIRNWLTKTDGEHSGVYYKTIPNITDFLVETNYRIDKMLDEKIEFADQDKKDYVTILGLEDYILAGGKGSYLNNGKVFYLLGIDEDKNYLSVLEDGSLDIIDNYSGYGVRTVITLKPNSLISGGNGSKEDPYVISQDKKINYVGNYVKLGNDIWKIYQDENGILRLYLNDYIKTPEGVIVNTYYSKYNSLFDATEYGSLAYYLNNIYILGLPYKDLLVPTNFCIGEISDDSGYNHENIYKRIVPLKIGLLNIFDYHINYDKENYFYINITSEIGDMQYVNNTLGLLVEENVREARPIVPVVSIEKKIIKSGKGSFEEPFVVE